MCIRDSQGAARRCRQAQRPFPWPGRDAVGSRTCRSALGIPMFGMGWPEIFVVGVVAMLAFGPDKLPEFARQAGKFVRTARQMVDNAKDDLGREMGHDFSGIGLRDLDPREVVRRHLLEDTGRPTGCLLYTSDAADDLTRVDL